MCFSVMLAVINIARHNNDDKKYDPHTSIPCVASSVYVLLMTSQSIGVDVTMQSRDLTIVTWACEKRYLTRHISILFTTMFISSRVRKWFFISKFVSRIHLITKIILDWLSCFTIQYHHHHLVPWLFHLCCQWNLVYICSVGWHIAHWNYVILYNHHFIINKPNCAWTSAGKWWNCVLFL